MNDNTPLLQTSRLRLRGWTDGDRAPFAALNADPEVMRHFPATLERAASDALARRSFRYSILYLTLLFAALFADRLIVL